MRDLRNRFGFLLVIDDLRELDSVAKKFTLDFDDASQYVGAKKTIWSSLVHHIFQVCHLYEVLRFGHDFFISRH